MGQANHSYRTRQSRPEAFVLMNVVFQCSMQEGRPQPLPPACSLSSTLNQREWRTWPNPGSSGWGDEPVGQSPSRGSEADCLLEEEKTEKNEQLLCGIHMDSFVFHSCL